MAFNPRGSRVDSPREPPTTPRKAQVDPAAIDDLVRELRDQYGLAIAPRDTTYSPAHCKDLPGDALYSRIQLLFWKDRSSLEDAIEHCKRDIRSRLSGASAKQRTDFVFEELHDPAWIRTNRIPTPLSRNLFIPTALPSPSKLRHGQVESFDSTTDMTSDSMPPSPLARKSVRNMTNSLSSSATPGSRESSRRGNSSSSKPMTAVTSFSDRYVDLTGDETAEQSQVIEPEFNALGSSPWPATQDMTPYPGSRRKVQELHPNQSMPPEAYSEESPRPAKRRKTDEMQDMRPPQLAEAEEKPKTPPPHYMIQRLQDSNFGSKYDVAVDNNVPYAVSVECARLMQDAKLHEHQARSITSHAAAQNALRAQGKTDFRQSTSAIWNIDVSKDGKDDAPPRNLVMSGTISFNTQKTGQPLQLTLHPIREDINSSRLERHFDPGLNSNRVLTMVYPSLIENLPSYMDKVQRDQFRAAFFKEVTKPKELLGRTWVAYNVDEVQRKRGAYDPARDREVKFFAIKGVGIDEPITRFQLLDWMFPFGENGYQAICKAIARISLSAKQTVPTLRFRHDQIRIIKDIRPNQETEDTLFEDPRFEHHRRKTFEKEVMTDGCGRISVKAAELVREHLGIINIPAAFQARINGAKGVWSINASPGTTEAETLDIWIEIRESQLKVKPRASDMKEPTCERDRDQWSFDVVGYSKPLKMSYLYRDFMPVLEDRHVPRDAIIGVVEERLKPVHVELMEAMQRPDLLAVWRYKHFGWCDEQQSPDAVGLMTAPASRVQFLVDKAGYKPQENIVVAEAVERMAEKEFQDLRSKPSLPCPESTYALGIADPLGVLRPGEIHLSLSQPIHDETTDVRFDGFAGRDVLIARHPTLRGSDMQKVRCISHPELAHLKDVIVMPSRGQIPLAAKLQGGDYDGDEFWICANEILVKPFLNAPVLHQAGLDTFGIKQETRRLDDIVDKKQRGTDEHAKAWLDIVLPFAWDEDILPTVTNHFYELAYTEGNLWKDDVAQVADLHDLIIDKKKNGLTFGHQDFEDLCKELRDIRPSNFTKREWKQNVNAPKSQANGKTRLRVVASLRPKRHRRHGGLNILDDLIFNTINPFVCKALDEVGDVVIKPALLAAKNPVFDRDLEFAITQLEAIPLAAHGVIVDAELKALTEPLKSAFGKWTQASSVFRSGGSMADYLSAKANCCQVYNTIQPKTDSWIWGDWKDGPLAPAFSERFRVAAMSRMLGKFSIHDHRVRFVRFMFDVAQETICYVKPLSVSGSKVVKLVADAKKPKKPANWQRLDMLNTAKTVEAVFDDGFVEGMFDEVSG